MKKFVVVLEETKSKTRYTITYEGLRRALEIDERIDYVFKRLIEIEKALMEALKPNASLKLLSLIDQNPNIKTGEINRFCIDNKRFVYHAYYQAFQELEALGQIIATSHSRGKQRTWKIKEV